MCSLTCTLGGRYFPDQDVLRWCPNCQMWFHIQCLHPAEGAIGPTLERNDDRRPVQPPTPTRLDHTEFMPGCDFTSYEYSIWRRLLNHPIERGITVDNFPLSFEMVFDKVRSTDRVSGCPSRVHNWLLAALGMNDHRQACSQGFLGLLIHMDDDPQLYRCSTCHYTI